MIEVHLKLEPDHMPKTTAELVDYLRTMSCVDYDTGLRRMPNFVDDQVFDGAADLIEAQEAALTAVANWINTLPIPTTGATRVLGIVRAALSANGGG